MSPSCLSIVQKICGRKLSRHPSHEYPFKKAKGVIGRNLIAHLHCGKFGPRQWVFNPGLSARDLVTSLIMAWILAVCTGNKITTYLGDISGAYDRVFTDYLLAKLQAAGVGSQYISFLEVYLQPRAGIVVVEGVCSEEFQLANTVSQDTVLGPHCRTSSSAT